MLTDYVIAIAITSKTNKNSANVVNGMCHHILLLQRKLPNVITT
jgi:hypothetical protein